VSRFHPDYKFRAKDWTPAGTIFDAAEIGKAAGLKYVYAGNLEAGKHENTCCPNCGTTLIERCGFSSRNTGLAGTRCSACGTEIRIIV
jgi:pyruvate formate lyase activating enzyme